MHPLRSHSAIHIIEELHERRRAETFAVVRFDAEIVTRVICHAELRRNMTAEIFIVIVTQRRHDKPFVSANFILHIHRVRGQRTFRRHFIHTVLRNIVLLFTGDTQIRASDFSVGIRYAVGKSLIVGKLRGVFALQRPLAIRIVVEVVCILFAYHSVIRSFFQRLRPRYRFNNFGVGCVFPVKTAHVRADFPIINRRSTLPTQTIRLLFRFAVSSSLDLRHAG